MFRTDASNIKPRIIIHGGAGNIKRSTLPRSSWEAYKCTLLSILSSSASLLSSSKATALDVATYAVTLLENDPLFNAGHGAVFTRAGTNELESSIMVSDGYQKRGVGCMMLTKVKNPIKLAREMLVRGEQKDGGGGQGHCQLSGPELEDLAENWGLEIVDPSYFFTQRRWEEHLRGLKDEKKGAAHSTIAEPVLSRTTKEYFDSDTIKILDWDEDEYLPQGTVGAVVLDSRGTVCVATSTGGLTNKLPGRIGDTPTIGAGFWAEEWFERLSENGARRHPLPGLSPLDSLSRGDFGALISSLLPSMLNCILPRVTPSPGQNDKMDSDHYLRHAIAVSGTGNGDSFLKLAAARTASSISRFSNPNISFAKAVSLVAGPNGELQKSAGDRWSKTGEGEGGMIGIELVGSKSKVVMDFNCGGMFRAWIDDRGKMHCKVFRDDY